jgi:hypothetical protein
MILGYHYHYNFVKRQEYKPQISVLIFDDFSASGQKMEGFNKRRKFFARETFPSLAR